MSVLFAFLCYDERLGGFGTEEREREREFVSSRFTHCLYLSIIARVLSVRFSGERKKERERERGGGGRACFTFSV